MCNSALGDSRTHRVDDEQPVLPDGESGYRAERKLQVWIGVALSKTVHVTVAPRSPRQAFCLAVYDLNAKLSGYLQITSAVQGLMHSRGQANAVGLHPSDAARPTSQPARVVS
jgi:hypothetical protein